MNRLTIIGNLTRDPEMRTTQGGINVCSFTVAVNRRRKGDGAQEADFFRVTAWRELGENCARYLCKGRKVAVTGPVSVSTYQGRDGKTYATLEVLANEVEFLTPRGEAGEAENGGQAEAQNIDPQSGYEQVDAGDELPF